MDNISVIALSGLTEATLVKRMAAANRSGLMRMSEVREALHSLAAHGNRGDLIQCIRDERQSQQTIREARARRNPSPVRYVSEWFDSHSYPIHQWDVFGVPKVPAPEDKWGLRYVTDYRKEAALACLFSHAFATPLGGGTKVSVWWRKTFNLMPGASLKALKFYRLGGLLAYVGYRTSRGLLWRRGRGQRFLAAKVKPSYDVGDCLRDPSDVEWRLIDGTDTAIEI